MKTLPRRAWWCLAGLLALVMLAGLWWLSAISDIPFRVGMTMEEVEIEAMVIQLTADGSVGGRYTGSGECVGLSVPVFRCGDFASGSTVIGWTYDKQERVDSVRRVLEMDLKLPWIDRKHWELPLPAP